MIIKKALFLYKNSDNGKKRRRQDFFRFIVSKWSLFHGQKCWLSFSVGNFKGLKQKVCNSDVGCVEGNTTKKKSVLLETVADTIANSSFLACSLIASLKLYYHFDLSVVRVFNHV